MNKTAMRWMRTAAALCLAGAAAAHAAAVADRPLRLVVPFAAGGLADVLARALAEGVHASFPKGVIVENKTGAGGNIGADDVFNHSQPGAYTLLISSPGPIAVNQGLYKKLTFDPTRWVAVGTIASVPNALIASPGLPVAAAKDFVGYVKANDGKVTYASQGNGTTSHLTAKLFESLTGTSMVHVPYKGDTPALTDLAGGQVDVFFGSVGAAINLHQGGRVRILAVADSRRSRALPETPTFAEIGLPGMNSVTWYAAVAAPGTPAADVKLLNEAIVEALNQPAMRERFAKLGLDAAPRSSADSAEFISQQTALWQKVIRDASVSID